MQKLELIGAFNILKNTQIGPFKMKYQINIFVEKGHLSDIILYLGDPTDEPDYPLLSEYISEHLGYLLNSDDDLWQYWFDYFSGDEEELENKKKSGISPKELIGELDKPLHPDSGEARDWMETAYEMKESPAARMLSFLSYELEKKIGGLHYIEGDRPGSNMCYVSADNMDTVVELKKVLEAKDYEVEISSFNW